MKFCPNCGIQYGDVVKFCGNCSSALKSVVGPDVTPVPPAPAAAPVTSAPAQFVPAAAPVTSAPAQFVPATAPVVPTAARQPQKLKDNYNFWLMLVLSIFTLGIYNIIMESKIGASVNVIAEKHDGERQMHYCLIYFVFSWLTLGIVPIVWYHRRARRIGAELKRRGINYGFGAKTFWLWGILGGLILVGWYIYNYKLIKAMNMLARDYNENG